MLINEAASILGLSKKSIRYYEQEEIIYPKRNSTNDYREYTDEDIRTLRLVKLLRDLDVSITDIKKLQRNEMTLTDCMQERIFKIEQEKNNYDRIKNLCLEIIACHYEYSTIDPIKYSKEVYVLRKKGFTLKKTNTNKSDKIKGAIVSSFIFNIFFIFMASIVTYFQFTESDKMPWILYGFIMLMLLLPVVGVLVSLVSRIKEINKGEEDEASKY